ncbi:MAG: hypothetical protein AAGA77_11350 [Bacteroidota bacterium]
MWKERLALYDSIIDKCSRFERKGKTMPFTSANGYMFTLLNKAGEIGIRFSKETQEKYMAEFDTTKYTSYNSTMKGYILIPDRMLSDIDFVAKLMEESFDYVMSLPPK